MADTTGYPALDSLVPRLAAIESLDRDALDREHTALLGRKAGILTQEAKRITTIPPEERRAFGSAVNALKSKFEEAFAKRWATLDALAGERDTVDRTMPGRDRWQGAIHPVTRVVDDVIAVFKGLGFAVATGPEIESEWTNFLALNFPPDHPAMDMHDTLYLADGPAGAGERFLLRTHTSPVQIHTMQAGPPPYRVVIPGMVYRKDPFDASHAPAFAQIEGLAVDEGISFVDLKATLTHFARTLFGADTTVRFRPSFFPFTEPSAEMDVRCRICGGNGEGCSACKGTGWMEILGCGMVHPHVLANVGVDPERYTGWAFGMGPARIAMNRYDIPDIRILYEGDMRFLSQFG